MELQRRDLGCEFRLVEQPELIWGDTVAAGAKALARQQQDLFQKVFNLLIAISQDLGVLLLHCDQVMTQPNDFGVQLQGIAGQ